MIYFYSNISLKGRISSIRQYQGNFTYREKNRRKNITGIISEIRQSEIVIKSKDKFQLIQIEDILQIELWEVDSLV
ncbi:hypothetical protein EFM07_06745 [Lactococcus lactis]|nr:hypothetical protein [Lactococcus lactis]